MMRYPPRPTTYTPATYTVTPSPYPPSRYPVYPTRRLPRPVMPYDGVFDAPLAQQQFAQPPQQMTPTVQVTAQYATTLLVRHSIVRRRDLLRVCGALALPTGIVGVGALTQGLTWLAFLSLGMLLANGMLLLLLHLVQRSEYVCDN